MSLCCASRPGDSGNLQGFVKFELDMEDKSLLLDTSPCASGQGVAPVVLAFGMPAQ